jgi:pimeloyl-ACP methyl ester carboxylesterase
VTPSACCGRSSRRSACCSMRPSPCPRFGRPALVAWAARDRVMPPGHGRRLAETLHAQLAEIDDSYTLIPLDQPAELARLLAGFTRTPDQTPAT